MSILGYSFFCITALFYIGLAVLAPSKPSMGGNDSMGYGLTLVFLSIGFSISSLLLTIIIRSKGGFDWVYPGAGARTSLVLLAWLVMALTAFFCALFRLEWHEEGFYPQFLHWLAVSYGELWIPLLWLVASFISLNSDGSSTLPPQAYKIPFWVGLSISLLYSGGLLVGYIRDSVQQAEFKMASQIEQEDKWHKIRLDEITAHKPGDPMINLLGYSNRFQDNDVRQAAIEKIKSYPNWEHQLLDLLTDKRCYREVYYFLGSNRVDHPEQFATPLNESLVWLSASINAEINDSSNLQSWSFDMYAIDHVLRAIDEQFLNQGVNFYPNVAKLKQALTTKLPDRFNGVRFTATDVVDEWLSEHKN